METNRMSGKGKMTVLLVLDLLGTLTFVLGAAGQFGGEGSYLPGPLQFPGHNWVLITLGVVLIVPYMVAVISKGRQGAAR